MEKYTISVQALAALLEDAADASGGAWEIARAICATVPPGALRRLSDALAQIILRAGG